MYGFDRRPPAAAGSPTRKPARSVVAARPLGMSPRIDDHPVVGASPTEPNVYRRPTSRSYAWGGLLSRLAA